jgi:hypothetical protein
MRESRRLLPADCVIAKTSLTGSNAAQAQSPIFIGEKTSASGSSIFAIIKLASQHGERLYIRYWQKAHNPAVLAGVRYWTKADNAGFWPGMVCPLMTQSGHRQRPECGASNNPVGKRR